MANAKENRCTSFVWRCCGKLYTSSGEMEKKPLTNVWQGKGDKKGSTNLLTGKIPSFKLGKLAGCGTSI